MTTTTATKVENKVCWFEIHTRDPEQSQAFFRGLFGWDFGQEIGDWGYWEIKTPDGSVGGGLVKSNDFQPATAAVTLYIQVSNLSDATQRVVELGGSVTREPKFISDTAGSYALINDPEGNVIGLWSSEGMTSP